MTKKELYDQAFMNSFPIEKKQLGPSLEYNSIEEWDSIGHMNLIGTLEDLFEIVMEMDDIIDFSSYQKGLELLEKYGIVF